jgi:hypothetical protein
MTSAEDPRCGIAVVLLSAAAVGDPDWRRTAETTTCPRLVPVRLDAVDASRLPSRLREINWVQLDQSSPERT